MLLNLITAVSLTDQSDSEVIYMYTYFVHLYFAMEDESTVSFIQHLLAPQLYCMSHSHL